MQPAAERAEQNDLPVAELVARCLHEECAVGRQRLAARQLAADVIEQIASGSVVEVVLALQPGDAFGVVLAYRQLAQEGADCQAKIVTATGLLAAPERHHRRRTLRRSDD